MVQSHDLQSLLSLSPHFVLRSQNQPQELNRWSLPVFTCVCVCACVCIYAYICAWVYGCACVFYDARNKDQSSGKIAYCHSCPLLICTSPHTQTHTHTPLLKCHIQWIYCVLSCCLLWMGTAAYLQWIVNLAEHSAVRLLWIANMSYLALLIPLYLPPITALSKM